MVWRHRFIIGRWVWELPGGYVDPDEDGSTAAAREVEEETSWRPRSVAHLLTFQPLIGSADCPQELYVAHGASLVGDPDVNEAEAVRWVALADIPAMVAGGQVVGAASVIGVQYALLPVLPLASELPRRS